MRAGVLVALATALAVVGAVPDAVGSTNTADFRAADKDQDGVVSPSEFKSFLHPSGEAEEGAAMGAPGFLPAFTNGLVMILITEVGDKTFFVAAIMAMKHNRTWVFLAVMGAMAIMTVLSVGIGFALPSLLPRLYTHYAAAGLFAYFGVQLLREAPTLNAGVSDELEEVEEELATPLPTTTEGAPFSSAEEGEGDEESSLVSRGARPVQAAAAPSKPTKKGFVAVITSVFTITFLAEWGDRSQIATIALAAAKDPLGVTLGGIVGHAICTVVAVVGGRLLATRISERTVAYVGGSLFLVFALHGLLVGPDTDEAGGHGLMGLLTR